MKNLSKIVILSSFALPIVASAATQMPYFGPDQLNCKIQPPSGPYAELDAGYVASEDCSFVYVLPPKFAVFNSRPFQIGEDVQNFCKVYKNTLNDLTTITATAGTPEYATAALRSMGQVQSYKTAVKEAFPGVSGYASASASFDWNGLVRAYRAANTDSPAEFVTMPVRVGVLSMASAGATSSNPTEEFENELFSIRVSSYTPPENSGTVGVDRLPLYLSFLEENKTSFIMGQSLGLEVRLGILGACGVSNSSNPKDALSGTYTYVYPVQSKGLVRYEYNKDALIPIIRDFILAHKGSFNTNELAQVIKDKKAFNVVINEGSFPDSGISTQIEEFKTDLSAKATEIMLSLLASQSAISMKASTWIESTSHSSTSCSGAWFWRRCRTQVWVTRTEHINWERFAKDLTTNLNVPDVSGQIYKTFYVMSTSAVVPKVGANK